MIVKNEERFLAECLASVRDCVDEINIVDTGSTDRTVEIARSFGANVIFREWRNDFAWARNEAVAHRFGVPIGEEIPASSIRTAVARRRGPSNARSRGGNVGFIGFALAMVSNALSHFADGQGIDPSGWWVGAIILAAGLAFAAMLWVQHRWGRRFTRQLRQFGGGSPGSKP